MFLISGRWTQKHDSATNGIKIPVHINQRQAHLSKGEERRRPKGRRAGTEAGNNRMGVGRMYCEATGGQGMGSASAWEWLRGRGENKELTGFVTVTVGGSFQRHTAWRAWQAIELTSVQTCNLWVTVTETETCCWHSSISFICYFWSLPGCDRAGYCVEKVYTK